ncbi:MAG: FtsX-like permease family protein [Candidatus Paceibacterota bacterium]
MLTRDILQLATRVFKTNKLRTLLTILGIGVGIGTILFLVSLGFGLQKLILEQITTSDALSTLDIFSENAELVDLNQETFQKIEATADVVEVSPMLNIPAQIEINSLSSGITVNAIKASYLKLSGIEMKAGRSFTDGETNKIIISSAILKSFNIENDSDAISSIAALKLYLPRKTDELSPAASEDVEEVNLPNDFEVVGIVDDDFSAFAYVQLSDIDYLNLPSFSRAKVKISNQNKVEGVREKLINMGFSVSSLSDTIDEANKIFQAVQIVLSLFGAVALIVSAIGMFNTMTIALLERTQEIGVMKSLGASRSDIWKLFLVESVLIGFLGGVSGIMLGVGAAAVSNFAINRLASSLGGESVNLFFTPIEFVITILSFSTIVGFMTGLYPARRASRLNPLDALRYK